MLHFEQTLVPEFFIAEGVYAIGEENGGGGFGGMK